MRLCFALACALSVLAAAVDAAPRDEYGYAWTLQLESGRAAHRLTLTEGVYARISDPGLRDLEAFNASGEPVPFGPVPLAGDATDSTASESRVSLPWFALPHASTGAAAAVSVRVERDPEGRLRSIDTDVDLPASGDDVTDDFLIDASSTRGAIEALELTWEPAQAPDVSAHFEVLGSNDFDDWYTLVPNASLVDLAQGAFRLTRRTIALPGNSARYVRLVRLDDGARLRLGGVTATVWNPGNGDPSPNNRRWSDARPARASGQVQGHTYRIVGPLPVERLAVRLASPNSVAQLTVQSRDGDAASWTTHGAFTAFRIEAGASVLEHDDIPIAGTRDRQWRVIAEPPLDRPPTLRVGFRPDQFAVLARGPAPYSLAAGSAIARRQEYPMAALLGALHAELGHEWQLPAARLAAPIALRGDAALLRPELPKPLKIWALWGVLSIGVVVVVCMVLRLLRSPSTQP